MQGNAAGAQVDAVDACARLGKDAQRCTNLCLRRGSSLEVRWQCGCATVPRTGSAMAREAYIAAPRRLQYTVYRVRYSINTQYIQYGYQVLYRVLYYTVLYVKGGNPKGAFWDDVSDMGKLSVKLILSHLN